VNMVDRRSMHPVVDGLPSTAGISGRAVDR
jgi:hypothetical protein